MDQRLAMDTIAIAASLRRDIEAMTDDQDVVRDTLEGAINLDEIIDWLLANIAIDEAMVASCGKAVSDMNKRIKRINERIATQRGLLRSAMKEALWDSCERPTATVTLGKKPACLGKLDEAKIPAKFWIDGDPKLDKSSLLQALLAKEMIPGAELAPDDVVLSIRRT